MNLKFEYAFHILAILLIIFGSVLIYKTHFDIKAPTFEPEVSVSVNKSLGDYPYPLHADSWNHFSLTKQWLDGSSNSNTNPQLAGDYYFKSKEKGFHIFLGLIKLATGLSLMTLFLILPAMLFGIGAGLLYLFFVLLLKKPIAGLFSILFLIFIPSNANILGFWFLTPSSMTLSFLAGLLILLFGLKKPKNIIFSSLLILISFFVYPVMTILLLFILLIYLIIEYRLWLKLKKLFSREYIIPSTLGIIILLLLIYSVYSYLIFPPGWTAVKGAQTIFGYLTIFITLLGLGGLYFLYLKNKFLFFTIGSYSLFGLLVSLIYFMTGYSFILPYQRVLFQWAILLSISAGYCVFELIDLLFIKFSKFSWNKPLISFLVSLVLVSLILLIYLPNYYVVKPENFAIQRMVHGDQKILLDSINAVGSKNILADPFFSTTIYPLSGNMAILATNGNLPGGDALNYNQMLKTMSCDDVKPYFSMGKIDFVIINKKLDCSFLNELKVSGDYYLYMVKNDELPLPIELLWT